MYNSKSKITCIRTGFTFISNEMTAIYDITSSVITVIETNGIEI